MNAVDTNVFVYALDDNEPIKQPKARALIDQLVRAPSDTILLWQVAGELLSCFRKWESAGRITGADVRANFEDVVSMFSVRVPRETVFEHSFDRSARFSLSHWDSMLLAACKEAGVTVPYSEDLDARTDYDGLSVVNPFA
jgi:predicted nucleic acid-binding protein